MENETKPILYNGFKLSDNLSVVKRIEQVFFTEVYSLSDNRYLYLFKKLQHDQILQSNNKQALIPLEVNDIKYVAIIHNEFSREMILKIRDDLTLLRGLSCVAGMKDLKLLLTNDVIKPLLDPEKYLKFKLSIPNGILLYGPPGCGKTYIVKKLAEELGYNFIELSPSYVASPYIHGAVGNIARVFETARAQAPSIIFIDELEGLLPKREGLSAHADIKKEEINEFLIQLNNAGKNKVLVVGATNRPHIIDSAILRSGRMDKLIYVPPPDDEARNDMFRLCLSGRPYDPNIDFERLSNLTDKFVSSDIELIVTEAARLAIAQNKDLIEENMLVEAISKISVRVTKEDIQYYENFSKVIRA